MDPLCGIRNCLNDAVAALYIETELETGEVGRVEVCRDHWLIWNRHRRASRRRHPARVLYAID